MCQHPWFGYFSTISCTPTTAPFSGERTILANAAEWQLGLHPTADLSHAVAQGMARANTSVSAGHGYSSIKIIALRSPGSCLWGNKRAQKHRKANQAWVMHFRDVVCRFSLLDILNLRYHTYIQTHTHTHTHTQIYPYYHKPVVLDPSSLFPYLLFPKTTLTGLSSYIRSFSCVIFKQYFTLKWS